MATNINSAPAAEATSGQRLHPLIWVVLLSTLASCFGGELFNKSISGYGWIVPLVYAMVSLLKGKKGFEFPLLLWLPWVSVVVAYQIFASVENSFQRSIMLLTPLVIGLAVSRVRIDESGRIYFLKLCRGFAIALILIVLYKTKMLFTGTLPFVTGLAPEVITGSLLCVIFASSYVLENKRDLAWWAALAVIPVIAVTRMGMAGAALSLPLTFAPMKMIKRFVFVSLLLIAGATLFYTERIQQKMFYSGRGSIEDMKWNNPNFATSGRSLIWDNVIAGIDKSPWFGKGANASETLVSYITGGLTHPHNDWLRLTYDYGFIGAIIFGLTLFWQVLDLLIKARSSTGTTRVLFFAGASSMLIFMLFMLTDNIILYASFFGNFQFTILGLAYASYRQSISTASAAPHAQRRRIRW